MFCDQIKGIDWNSDDTKISESITLHLSRKKS